MARCEGDGSATRADMWGGRGEGDARRFEVPHYGALVSASPTSPSPGGVLSVAGAEAARAWIADALDLPEAALEVEVVRRRAWGDIWRVEAGARFWFKAPHPRLAREVPLRERLQVRAPGAVVPLVAAHRDRGWQLTEDAGPTLAVRARDDAGMPRPDVGPGLYGNLARALGAVQQKVSAEDLAGLGLAEFDPMRAVETFERKAAPFRALPADHPAHCNAEAHRGATTTLAGLVRRWEEAGGTGLPLGLDHNDAHGGNAFVRDGRVVLSDWGDAVLGHPFASLRALLVPLRNTFGAEAVPSVRRAYLEAVGAGSPPSAQEETLLDLAMMLAVPNRLSAWGNLQDEDAWAEHADWITALWRETGTPIGEVTVP